MPETWLWSLGWKGRLENGMATHSSILAWRIPWAEEPGGIQSMQLQRARHDWATNPTVKRRESLSALQGLSRKMASCRRGRGSHQNLAILAPWSQALQAPELWEIDFYCLTHPIHGIFFFLIIDWTETLTLLWLFFLLHWLRSFCILF